MQPEQQLEQEGLVGEQEVEVVGQLRAWARCTLRDSYWEPILPFRLFLRATIHSHPSLQFPKYRPSRTALRLLLVFGMDRVPCIVVDLERRVVVEERQQQPAEEEEEVVQREPQVVYSVQEQGVVPELQKQQAFEQLWELI